MSAMRSCGRTALNSVSSTSRLKIYPALFRPKADTPSQTLGRAHSTTSSGEMSRTTNATQDADLSRLANHLQQIFPPLKFPPDLSARMLTHSSHRDARTRHNARLSFIGRRVLNSYLMMFLHSSPAQHSTHDYESIAQRTLNTYFLGEHVAPKWAIGRVLRWSPVNIHTRLQEVDGDFSRLSPNLTRSVGLYKVQGGAVEAIVGGVFHHFGGNVAHQVFHTRVLPHILLPGTPTGLHDVFHDHAMRTCERMGGVDGLLVTQNDGLGPAVEHNQTVSPAP